MNASSPVLNTLKSSRSFNATTQSYVGTLKRGHQIARFGVHALACLCRKSNRFLFSGGSISSCKILAGALWLLLPAGSAFPAIWFVATNGLDSNAGDSNSPLATIMQAQSNAA